MVIFHDLNMLESLIDMEVWNDARLQVVVDSFWRSDVKIDW